ncbi:MAG: hypothetical protein J0H83_15540 [Candidatus Melainabacteria bacterium]|nr:hypothetical protein [Candidatus Melainabacteria bacterium]MBX9674422.1 hypothetical protein [Candidatus Obscuribacterales bacterium]
MSSKKKTDLIHKADVKIKIRKKGSTNKNQMSNAGEHHPMVGGKPLFNPLGGP